MSEPSSISIEERNELVLECLWVVQEELGRIAHIFDDVDQGEMYSLGTLALVETAGRYDPTREDPNQEHSVFPAYARRRIRGAMMDGMERWFREEKNIPKIASSEWHLSDNSAYGEAESRDFLELVRDRLTSVEYLIVSLHFLDGKTFLEIATEIEKDRGIVAWHFYRALKKLKRYLGPRREDLMGD